MLRVFIDYPNPTINCHADPECHLFHRPEAPGHRFIRISASTISKELGNLSGHKYVFGAQRELNSMWLEVDFNDQAFELAVVEHIRRLLMGHYTPFGRVKVSRHCG